MNIIEIERQRAATLNECHRLVWAYRDKLEPFWPTPDIWDSLLFCQTEIGEVIDAYMRTKPEYARNRAKDTDVLDELGDLALMAFTALGKVHDAPCGWWKPYDDVEVVTEANYSTWASYACYVADALDKAINFYDGVDAWRPNIISLLNAIAVHPGMDLPARLRGRLERIAAKRLPQGEPTP